ncbi:MAG: Phosphoglycerate kinase [Alphaproteobacteria bacterium MarineAlpha9_Bin2]|nr:MAG: Phosphoglycerate kinase [Alphaproteobacteria bacterium MarineAlpha9_Bin2]
MKLRTMDSIEVSEKIVLLRCDLNVPVSENGEITDTSRIERLLPTVSQLSSKGAKIALLSHFGRPAGKYDEQFSLNNLSDVIAEVLQADEITVIPDCIGKVTRNVLEDLPKGGIALLENVRFYPGEEKNDIAFSKSLSEIADIYINDAFSVSHRRHASIDAITKLLPSYAGRALQFEVEMLDKVLKKSNPPVLAIIGGSKVSTKLGLLDNLVEKMETIAIGGGMANTFLAAKNTNIGSSFFEETMINDAKSIIKKSEKIGCQFLLPVDVVVANKLESGVKSKIVDIDKVPKNSMILDIGPKTVELFTGAIVSSKTLLWNGPLGVFEVPPFDQGTSNCALTAAMLSRSGGLISVAGGGDTIAALNNAGASGGFSYVSAAGGAFLEWIEGKILPGIIALREKEGERK